MPILPPPISSGTPRRACVRACVRAGGREELGWREGRKEGRKEGRREGRKKECAQLCRRRVSADEKSAFARHNARLQPTQPGAARGRAGRSPREEVSGRGATPRRHHRAAAATAAAVAAAATAPPRRHGVPSKSACTCVMSASPRRVTSARRVRPGVGPSRRGRARQRNRTASCTRSSSDFGEGAVARVEHRFDAGDRDNGSREQLWHSCPGRCRRCRTNERSQHTYSR